MNSFSAIRASLVDFIRTTFILPDGVPTSLTVTINTDPHKDEFGDMSTNAAMVLAKIVRQAPQVIARTIVSDFRHPDIERLEIAGAGFVNIYLTPQAFQQTCTAITQEHAQFFRPDPGYTTQRYSVEFVSANPTGPLHIGHGRGGIIGDVLARILRFLGNPVTTEFYINDAGAQIHKLGLSLQARVLQELGKQADLPEEGYQGEYLIDLARQCIAEHPTDIQDQPVAFFAQYAQDHLLRAIKETLQSYGITFDIWFSETTLHENGAIERAIHQLMQHGHIYEKDGALWLATTKFGDDKDRVVKRAHDGPHAYTYVAADIAYLLDKLTRADKLVMVLGQDHHSYVTRLKAILAASGYNPEILTVILYQLVTVSQDGQELRLSKRAGRIVGLKDLIDTVGCDVARFFYLNRKADAHLDFDLGTALKTTDDNPVYYLHYAYVRLLSMLAKAASYEELKELQLSDIAALTPHEHLLLRKIAALKDLLQDIGRTYQTHQVSYFAYELAHLVHTYYAKHKVIDLANLPVSRARLMLARNVVTTFKVLFDMLGMSAPERM